MLDEVAVDFLRLGFAADGLPERVAEVEVVGDGGGVSAGGVHGFVGDFGGGRGERGEDASGMKPPGAVLGAEDFMEIEISGLTWLTAVRPRSEQPAAARTPKPRSVKLRPLRMVRPTPS